MQMQKASEILLCHESFEKTLYSIGKNKVVGGKILKRRSWVFPPEMSLPLRKYKYIFKKLNIMPNCAGEYYSL